MEQFRDRPVEFKSLNTIRELIGELYASELGEPLPLPRYATPLGVTMPSLILRP